MCIWECLHVAELENSVKFFILKNILSKCHTNVSILELEHVLI